MENIEDIIAPDLNILFIGYNPGLRSAETGHHFAGYSNRFWKLLAASGITPILLRPEDDRTILQFGIGITNIVARPSRKAEEIAKEEYREGKIILQRKLAFYKPRIACYTGIGVYKEFTGITAVKCGLQPISVVEKVIDFVVPSPSGLTRILFQDQLAYYLQLKELIAAGQEGKR